MGGDRRRQRQERVRHEVGGGNDHGGTKSDLTYRGGSYPKKGDGVAYAEPKQYEAVTIMESKEEKEEKERLSKEKQSTTGSSSSSSSSEPQKYQRRQILSNWSRYADLEPTTEAPEEGEDYLMGEDFSQALKLNEGNMGGYLHLKGEMSWGEADAGVLSSHGMGALRMADLVSAINTIPLHIQLSIPQESLPDAVIENFTLIADTNKKSYKPNQEYASDMDISDKLLQSLKLTDEESLDLNIEVVESSVESPRNAIDLTLKLSSAFQPEDDDVDLDSLMSAQQSQNESYNNEVNNSKIETNVEAVNVKEKFSHQDMKDNSIELPHIKEKSAPPMKQKSPSPMPDASYTSKQVPPSMDLPQQHIKQKSPSPFEAKPIIKEKSPSPLEVQRNLKQQSQSNTKLKDSKPMTVPALNVSNLDSKTQTKGPMEFDFGLPKQTMVTDNVTNTQKDFDFGLPKLQEDGPKGQRKSRKPANKQSGNVVKPVEEGLPEEDEQHVDLDAPVHIEKKPILIVSEKEAENLEDWLDSVLDD